MVEKKTFNVLSSDGVHNLAGVVYLPDGEVKGLFHVVHGMTEHMARYDKFLTDMAKQGYVSFGYNHLGHKDTADDSELGYIAKENGWELLVKDVKVFSDAVREKFGNAELPLYLMGHSMGSFVVRLAAERVASPDKLIVMGTGGPNPAAGVGLALIEVIKRIKGERHFSKLIDGIAFGSYNEKFGGGSESDPSPWLTNDDEIRKIYYADKYCTFKFSVSAMGDLIRLIKYSNDDAWFKNISAELPILLVSGEDDPVGDYGKGVLEVESRLKKNGKNVTCKLYRGARHEILNDFTYQETLDDILEFCAR
jgi:alpha-beta hydrolase superfamily lysophospholipase